MGIFLSKAEDGFDMRKEILKLSGPIIAQSMIVYLVMAVENLLIGRILPSAFAAMTLTTQIYNITSLVIQGIIGGGNILFAKHFGSRDYPRMRCIIRYEFVFTAVFIGGVSAACLAAPRLVMSILTDHEDLIYLGGIYIRVMGTAWLLASCSMVVIQVLRTIGEAGFPMKVAAAEMTSELIATAAILSSGLSPEGKLRGIALSFLGLKLLEFGVLSVCLGRKTAQWTRSTERVPGFFGTFFQTVLPVTANELLRPLGDVRFCFLNDILFQWLYIIPGTWLLLNAVQVPFAVVFFFMKTDQVVKVFTSESRINFVLRKNDTES